MKYMNKRIREDEATGISIDYNTYEGDIFCEYEDDIDALNDILSVSDAYDITRHITEW